MWSDYIVIDDFLQDKHFNIIKSIPFITGPDQWEIFKHQIFLNEIKVSYKNSSGIDTDLNLFLNDKIILDIHKTYHEIMISYLKNLAPDKVDKYKYTELNIVSNGSNFKFPIHNDSLNKLLSVVIYISPEKNKGTTLYSDKLGNNSFDIEWKPNRAFIFSRKDHTWHSYESDGLNKRITLVYNLRG